MKDKWLETSINIPSKESLGYLAMKRCQQFTITHQLLNVNS